MSGPQTSSICRHCQQAGLNAKLLDTDHQRNLRHLAYNVKVKEGHTAKERRQGAHLPFIGRWARRWINHYCLWRMARATPNLRLPSQPKLILILPTQGGMVRRAILRRSVVETHLPFIGRWACRWINHYVCDAWPVRRQTYGYLPSLSLPTKGWPGWVDLGGWLHTEIVYPPEDGHPSRH